MRSTQADPRISDACRSFTRPGRINSKGLSFRRCRRLEYAAAAIQPKLTSLMECEPVINGVALPGVTRVLTDPSDRTREIGAVLDAT